MKTILVFGDSNTWGCKPIHTPGLIERYSLEERWTTIMRQELGEGFDVAVEGQNGRTMVHDDPIDGRHKNGSRFLITCLETHLPLDLVVIMLGTNDLKTRFGQTAFDVASGIKPLLETIHSISPKNGGRPPETLVISPPPFSARASLPDMFAGSLEKSKELARHMKTVAAMMGSHFLDAGEIIKSSDTDGFHWDQSQLQPFGIAVANEVKRLFEAK